MMKLVLLAAVVSVALAATQPIQPVKPIAILRSESDITPEGKYSYSYETENGISADESGEQTGPGEDAGTSARGSYRYTGPEGQVVEISYVANEEGFQASGDAIPQPPAIPEAIVKALEHNAANPAEDAGDKPSPPGQSGQYRPIAPPAKYSPVGAYTLGSLGGTAV